MAAGQWRTAASETENRSSQFKTHTEQWDTHSHPPVLEHGMALLVILYGIHNNIVIMCAKLGDRVGGRDAFALSPSSIHMASYASSHIYNYAYGRDRTSFSKRVWHPVQAKLACTSWMWMWMESESKIGSGRCGVYILVLFGEFSLPRSPCACAGVCACMRKFI